jgi:hypothetical protein
VAHLDGSRSDKKTRALATALSLFFRQSSGRPLAWCTASGRPGNLLVRTRAERFVGDVRVGLYLIPKMPRYRIDAEADPAIVLAGIAAWRVLEVATGGRRAVEDDVVILARIPPQPTSSVMMTTTLGGRVGSACATLAGAAKAVAKSAGVSRSSAFMTQSPSALKSPDGRDNIANGDSTRAKGHAGLRGATSLWLQRGEEFRYAADTLSGPARRNAADETKDRSKSTFDGLMPMA